MVRRVNQRGAKFSLTAAENTISNFSCRLRHSCFHEPSWTFWDSAFQAPSSLPSMIFSFSESPLFTSDRTYSFHAEWISSTSFGVSA